MRLLVVNADDFGLDPAVNAAVEQAHTQGILTSASLMVSAAHAQEAMECAKRYPKLGVGIHLCLVDARPTAAPEDLGGLIGDDGQLPKSPGALAAKLGFAKHAEEAVEVELRAQIGRFLSAGLNPTHLDTHMHAHIQPRVLEIVARLAREYKVPFVRAPVEPLGMALRCGRRNLPRKLARWTIFSTLGGRARRRLRQRGVRTVDRAIGVLDPGHLTEEFLLAYLKAMPEGLTEIFFHPATETSEALRRYQPRSERGQHHYQHTEELQALCSPRAREVIERRGIRLMNFRELAGAGC